jgi:hypothetical protein
MNPVSDPVGVFMWFFGGSMVLFIGFWWMGTRGSDDGHE